MKHQNFIAARNIINVLESWNLIELIKAIDGARADGSNAVRNALVSHVVMHKRSEITNLSQWILPDMGMGPESFLQWLAYSEFGRCVRALVGRPQMSFENYQMLKIFKWGRNREVSGVPKNNADMEMNLKRIASAVLIEQIEIRGLEPRCHWFFSGSDDTVSNTERLARIEAFASEQMSDVDFFTSGDPALGDHESFYNTLVNAGVLIHSDVKGTP